MNVVVSIPSFSNSVNPLVSNFKLIRMSDFPMVEAEKIAIKRFYPEESGYCVKISKLSNVMVNFKDIHDMGKHDVSFGP